MTVTAAPLRIHELEEHAPLSLDGAALAQAEGERLLEQYGGRIRVDFPSPSSAGRWRLVSRGWVGYIPLSPELGLSLRPKVPITNLFRMLEYAYDLKSFQFLEGLTGMGSLAEVYERLASVLARRVIDRTRKGLYRSYLGRRDALPYLRGALDLREHLRRPWAVDLSCAFQEHTADLEDNQILSWTLQCIARTQACSERVRPLVRRAYRSLLAVTTLQPFTPDACLDRPYTRLNDDYRPLHALCRFFLAHTGPTHEQGGDRALPFLVDMNQLFELFVARWLGAHLPPGLRMEAQEPVSVGDPEQLRFAIDLVLYRNPGHRTAAVLDTKYKAPEAAATGDVAQVVAYAELKGCTEAFLVYPQQLSRPLDVQIGRIRVRSLAFPLRGDLERAGQELLRRLVAGL